MAPGTTCPAPRLYCSGGGGAADRPNERRDRRHELDTSAIRARPLRGLRNQDLRSSADRSLHARLAGSAPARGRPTPHGPDCSPGTQAASKPPQARLVPRLSLGVLRQPTTRRKTADRTLANERCARPSASLDPSEQEDASTRLVCPASATRRHPTARTPCPRLRRTAQTRRRLLSLVERCRSSRALRRRSESPDRARSSAWRTSASAQERSPAEPDSARSPAAVVSQHELSGHIIRRVYEYGGLVGVRLLEPEPQSHPRRPAGAGHTDSYLQYISRSPRISQAWVSVSAASIVVGVSGAVRRGGLRSRACRCSRGRRPSGCGTEARGRRATLPQRHRSGVGGSLTQTPLRRAYRLQRPCSLPIVGAYFGSA